MSEKRKAVQLRVPPENLELIDQAAKSLNITRTELMIKASLEFANEQLLDQQRFVWNSAELKAFDSAIEASTKTNSDVVALMKKRAS